MSITYATTLDLHSLRDDIAPLYLRYEGQINAQPAFVELDEEGEISTAIGADSGCGMAVWHRRTLQWRVPSDVSGPAMIAFLESDDARSLLERVHAGHTVEWNGNNHVGRLNDEAREASDEFAALVDRELHTETARVAVWRAGDWLFASGNNSLCDVWPAGQSLDEAEAELEAGAKRDGCYLDGDVRDELVAKARQMLDAEEPGLTAEQLAALVADGEADADDVSAYMAAISDSAVTP